MDDTALTLLLKYPLISKALKKNVTDYKGSIHVNDEDYKIVITETTGSNFKLTLPQNLIPFEEEIDVLMTKLDPKNIVTILDNLCSFIDGKIPSTKLVDYSDVYKHVLYEYSDFTKFYLNLKSSYLAYDLSKISIATLDDAGREHSFDVSIDFNDKNLFRMTSYDLPQDQDMFRKSSSLKDVYDQFLGAVETVQPFLDIMDIFDKSCWVLDPEEPKRSSNYRRIWISENFSLIITLDPFDVSKLPEIKFLGPERLVSKYRDTLNTNLLDWEPVNDTFSQILKLLGLEHFPQKPAVEECGPNLLVESGDCSICFSLRLNDKLPEVVCRNKFCENCYHAECLYEWLMSVNARRFYSEVVGLCPNCEKSISCPIPK